jgi:hypothetical protein
MSYDLMLILNLLKTKQKTYDKNVTLEKVTEKLSF